MGFCGIGGHRIRQNRRLPELFLVTSVLHHVHKSGNGSFRRAVGWQACIAEQAAGFLRRVFATPVRQYRDIFTARMVFQRVDQGEGAFGSRCGGAGGMNHQQGVVILAIQQNVQRLEIVFAAGIVTEIQRVSDADTARQRLA